MSKIPPIKDSNNPKPIRPPIKLKVDTRKLSGKNLNSINESNSNFSNSKKQSSSNLKQRKGSNNSLNKNTSNSNNSNSNIQTNLFVKKKDGSLTTELVNLNKKYLNDNEATPIDLIINNNKSYTVPLIEKVLFIGISNEDLKTLNTSKFSYSNYSIINHISSTHLKDKEDYTGGMISYIFHPSSESIILSEDKEKETYKLVEFTFSIFTSELKRKHCSVIKYFDNIKIKEKTFFIQNAIILISSFPLYQNMLSIQKKLLNIYNLTRKNIKCPEKLDYYTLKISRIKELIIKYSLFILLNKISLSDFINKT